MGKKIDWNTKVGEENINTSGKVMRIMACSGSNKTDIQFEDGTIVYNKNYYNFKKGKILNPSFSRSLKSNTRIGETIINNQGFRMKIIEYKKCDDISVEFEDGFIARNKKYQAFKAGEILNENYPSSIILKNSMKKENEISLQKCGLECKLNKYINSNNVIIEFIKTGEVVNTTYDCFKRGDVKSHFTPTVCGVGIVGNIATSKNGERDHAYLIWKGMLKRCYEPVGNNISYKGCTVCEEWHYYPNFKMWYEDNSYDIDEELNIDKDILVNGNKIYSPTTCMIVPKFINGIFINSTNGNFVKKTINKNNTISYNSTLSTKYGRINLGTFKTQEDSFNSYKQAKEKYIKEVADLYKDKIPQKLYDAMYRWEVNITD